MKRVTKALLVIFVIAATGLYMYLFAIPKIEGMSESTAVLEYGDLQVLDKANVLIVRDETLFGSKKSGAVEYGEDEGTKVRKGVKLVTVEEGAGAATSAAIDRVREASGDAMKMTGSYKANRTAVVSYFADGYEKKLSAKTMDAITRDDMAACPSAGEPLKKDRVTAGDPVYKLTDNNEWYMVYWTEKGSEAERYATGGAVTVSFGESLIDAKIHSATPDGGMLKVILRSDMYFKDLTRVRKSNAEVVFAEYNGLVADVTNIAERKGAPGVFVKQRSGGYKWVPVKILKETGGKCTLSAGVYYDEAGEAVNTVNYYDEVLADPGARGYE
jgi:putative membrane fusion protein